MILWRICPLAGHLLDLSLQHGRSFLGTLVSPVIQRSTDKRIASQNALRVKEVLTTFHLEYQVINRNSDSARTQ